MLDAIPQLDQASLKVNFIFVQLERIRSLDLLVSLHFVLPELGSERLRHFQDLAGGSVAFGRCGCIGRLLAEDRLSLLLLLLLFEVL